jgi:hypothetical protein
LEFELVTKNDKMAAFEAEVARLTKTRKRKAILNPNKRFVLLFEALASEQPITKNGEAIVESGVDSEGSEEVIKDEILVHNSESEEEFEALVQRTRSGRAIKNPRNL